MKLEGRVAIVTGASSGLGRVAALGFARAGADVVVAARRVQPLEELAAEIADLGRNCLVLPTDVARPEDVFRMAAQTVERFGRIDILYNCAGVGYFYPVRDMPVAVWDETFAINIRGTFLACQAVLPTMMVQRRGAIINVASAERGYANRSAYNATKVGMVAFTQALAEEAGEHNISVNCIRMGVVVDTLLGRNLHPGHDRSEWQQPEDTLDVVLYLARQDGSGLTGAYVNVYEWRKQMGGPLTFSATPPPSDFSEGKQ